MQTAEAVVVLTDTLAEALHLPSLVVLEVAVSTPTRLAETAQLTKAITAVTSLAVVQTSLRHSRTVAVVVRLRLETLAVAKVATA